MFSLILLPVLGLLVNPSQGQLNSIASVPPEDTYLLPADFKGNYSEGFVGISPNGEPATGVLTAAKNATFVAYTSEFLDIIGPNPSLNLTVQRNSSFAYEAGVWVPPMNQVWFTSPVSEGASILQILDLSTNEVFVPNTSTPVLIPNGGTYFAGNAYICVWGNASNAAGIQVVNTTSYESEMFVNSYFGLPFNGPDDATWVKTPTGNYLFFTDPDFSADLNYSGSPQLPNAVWRFDPQQQTVLPVVSRSEITIPNGVAANADGSKIYITDTPVTELQGGGPGSSTGSSAIFEFDLDAQARPVNKRMFGLARTGIPDGIHVDDSGRVWTGEGEGIVVRNQNGTILGLFNRNILDDTETAMANFALAGDTLVILGLDRIWTLKLAMEVISASRFEL